MKNTVLIVGAGMYVCGSHSKDNGTILPSLIEASRQGLIRKIIIVTKSKKSLVKAKSKCSKIKKYMESNIPIFLLQADMTKKNNLGRSFEKT